MFGNIGRKIKIMALIFCAVGLLVSLIGALALWTSGRYNSGWTGLAVLFFGSLCTVVNCFFIYGFGELITRSVRLDEKVNSGRDEANRAEVLSRLAQEGLISEEEYYMKAQPQYGAVVSGEGDEKYV